MATLESRLNDFAAAVGADIKDGRLKRGDLATLSTTAKNTLVAAINELFTTVSGMGGGSAIDDNAGDGITNKTWSANKIYDEIVAAKAAVKSELTDGAAAALDTLAELAAALGNDANFAATISTALGLRVRVDAAQTLTGPQQTQARSNIGAQSAAAIGNPDADLVAIYTTAKT